MNYAYLLAHDDQPLTAEQNETYRAWVARAAQGEPVPYITGTAPFYGRDFAVNPAVLIPRPETEQLVELACKWLGEQAPRPPEKPWRIIDVGAGSGCIPITVALESRQAVQITAVDVSPAALTVAQENARRLGANVHFVQSDLLTAVSGSFDLITANLPYIADAEWPTLDDGVKSYEPALALRGGVDGLDLIGQLLHQAVSRLHTPSLLLLEIGWQQGSNTAVLAQRIFPNAAVAIHQDYAGHDRFVAITHPA
ncbi:MAG: peptide chain release factor N(5)-glutamine methyltransferase [Anaerolineales bacterium]|nr:peptide chain release factor N(5)-glutamine methyltransferase [Anaerolineales bacterium]